MGCNTTMCCNAYPKIFVWADSVSRMNIDLSEEPMTALADLARISTAFKVEYIYDIAVREGDSDRFLLSERRLDVSYVKDYDAIKGEVPLQWPARFDLSNWGLILARSNGQLVGGAAIAFDSPEIGMLEGRSDLAVLWDIRVSPEARGQGVGSALFQAAETWAKAKGCRQLKVETQNINVPACKFYARQGCRLGAIDRSAYPGLPEEIQLFWYKNLAQGGGEKREDITPFVRPQTSPD